MTEVSVVVATEVETEVTVDAEVVVEVSSEVTVRTLALPKKYPAPAPASSAITTRAPIAPFFTPQRVASRGVKFYSCEQPSDFGGIGVQGVKRRSGRG